MPEQGPHKIKIKLCRRCDIQQPPTVSVCPGCHQELRSAIMVYPEGALIREKYQIKKLLGHGAMGMVYHARHPKLERDVAIKFIHPHLLKDQKQFERFRREAVAASAVDHPNALRVIDIDENEEGHPFLVTEFLQGQDLEHFLRKEPTPSIERICHILVQVLDALEVAHEQNIVHRDLKPGNLFLLQKKGAKDQVKIVDFGLAKLLEKDQEGRDLTTKGTTLGTPYYMSPEQVRGEPLDGRSDLWAVGVILYQMLAGRLPFMGPSAMQTALMVLKDPLEPPSKRTQRSIPPELEALCVKALSKPKEQRPQTAAAFKEELQQISQALAEQAAGRSVPSMKAASMEVIPPNASTSVVAFRKTSPSRLPAIALGFLGMLVGLGLVWALWPASMPPVAAPVQPTSIAVSQPASTPTTLALALPPTTEPQETAPEAPPKNKTTKTQTPEKTQPKEEPAAPQTPEPKQTEPKEAEPKPTEPPKPPENPKTPPAETPAPLPANLSNEQQAKMLFMKKDFAGSIPFFEAAIKEKPNDPVLHRRLGDAYHKTGQDPKAVAQWREFIRLAPNHVDVPKVQSDIDTYK